MRRAEMRWDEVRRAHMIWDEVKCGVWSASVKCEVRGVKSAVCSVKKVFAWSCIAPGSRAGHVLGQQQCNRFAQSTHARAWLAHGACKFYRWKRCYSTTLRQLPPRVRVLLVLNIKSGEPRSCLELSQQHLDEIAPGQAPVSDLFLARQEPKKPEVKALPSCPRELDGMVDMDMALL